MSHLSKLTVWCISIFFVLTLASAIVAGHMRTADTSVVEEESSIALEITDDTAAETAKPVEASAEAANATAAAEEKPAAETQK